MKKTFLTTLALFFVMLANSQTVINYPKFAFRTAKNVIVTKLELTDSTTELSFQVWSWQGSWIIIPDKSYIEVPGSGNRLILKRTEGIEINKQITTDASGKHEYKVIFPALPKNTKKFDFGEGNGGSWFIYGIEIQQNEGLNNIPEFVYGNWTNQETGFVEISFLDSVAIYQNQIWKYGKITTKKESCTIDLISGKKTQKFYVKKDKKDFSKIGIQENKLSLYCKDEMKALLPLKDTGKPVSELDLKADSATYSVYIQGYSTQYCPKTMTLYVNNIITGEQNNYLINIAADGYFSVKVPVINPNMSYVRSSFYNGGIYLEPGKELFQLFGAWNNMFMGELGRLNTELEKLPQFTSNLHREMYDVVLEMKPAAFKEYLLNFQKRDYRNLDSMNQTKTISAKAYQIRKLDIQFLYPQLMLGYKMYVESGYRRKNNIPNNQREIPLKIDSLPIDYYSFINNEINNPVNLVSSNYFSLINFLKFSDILFQRISTSRLPDTEIIKAEIKNTGKTLSTEENETLDKIQELNQLNKAPEYEKQSILVFNEYYTLYRKYVNQLRSLSKNSMGILKADSIELRLKKSGIAINDSISQVLKLMREDENSATYKAMEKIYDAYSTRITKFFEDYNIVFRNYNEKSQIENRNKRLKQYLHVEPGLVSDIMTSQDILRKVFAELTPLTEYQVKNKKQLVVTPFISNYIEVCNNEVLAKLEASKNKPIEYTNNETPKTEADKLFDKIMEKYKGKVVYVDFWATWCGPCRSGIAQIKPLKDELEKQNIAFVYITNETSPLETYNNFIPTVKGEHYRLTNDEWNYICNKFNVSGIPHYVLVGKKGEIINPNFPHMDNNGLKEMLLKEVAKE